MSQHELRRSAVGSNMRPKMWGTAAPLGVLASIAGLTILTCLASPKTSAGLLPGALLQAEHHRRLPDRRVRCCGEVGHYYAFVAAARSRASSHGRLKGVSNRNRCSTSIPRRAGVLEMSPIPNDDSSCNGDAAVVADVSNKRNKHTALQGLQQSQQHTLLVFELQSDGKQSEEDLAVYGKLHRLLGRRRRLLGANVIAIMTTLNFLVVHYCHGENTGEQQLQQQPSRAQDTSSITAGSYSRLPLGDRRWDVCGVDVDHGDTAAQGARMDSAAQEGSKERGLLDTVAQDLQRTIEDVVKVASRTEVFPAEVKHTDTQRRHKPQGDVLLLQQTLRALYGRVRATTALARTSARSAPGVTARNPLLLVGVGALLSRKDCETVAREAEEKDDWVPWEGDLGASSMAVSLENLPRSRDIWEGAEGHAVRARIAEIYGVREGSIVSEPGDVFVCKVCPDARGQFEASVDQRRVEEEEEEEESIDGSRWSASADFSRSKSLVTFSVALSAGLPRWAVCLEQRRQCLRPTEQGSGVVFSGKLRHASVMVTPEARTGGPESAGGSGGGGVGAQNQVVLLLRGFASIGDPCVREDSRRWAWGSPAWHVGAPWVKDEDILNRVWVESRWDDRAAALVVTTPPATNLSGEETSPAEEGPGDVGISESTSPQQLCPQRMITSAAHRYYRQGLEGMGIPVVDELGRPAIDLEESRVRSSWLPGSSGKKSPEFTIEAVLRRRFPWGRRRQVGKAGLSTAAGSSPRMDAALGELFGPRLPRGDALVRVPVPPIKYVFVDPRFRGLGLGRRLFLEAMCSLARRGFRFALIIVEDNGSGGLFGFYEEMGFVAADELLGIPRAMIAPIPPPQSVLAAHDT